MDGRLREEVAQLHAQVCAGLADTNRILLLYALSESARSVNELADILALSQPTVSRHLKILRDRGLVCADRKGQLVYYKLQDWRVIQALDLLRAVLGARVEEQARTVLG